MKKRNYIFLIFTLCIVKNIFAQNNYTEDRCISYGNETGSALGAGDFNGLKDVSEWVIKNCKGLISIDYYYDAFASLSIAKEELGDINGALNTVNLCIKSKYDTVDCHVQKYKVLTTLKKINEANIQKKIALALVNLELNKINHNETESSKKAYSNAKFYKLNSMTNYLNQ